MTRFFHGAGWPESLENGGESGACPAPDVSRPTQLSAARVAAHARPPRYRRLLDILASPGRSPGAVVCHFCLQFLRRVRLKALFMMMETTCVTIIKCISK